MIYYVDISQPSRAMLKERGFPADLCDIAGMPGAQVLSGPDGKSGTLFHCATIGYLATPEPWTPLRFDPNTQQWFERGNGIWFGWETRPTPKTLRRKVTLPGHPVKLRDGNEWEIPYIRFLSGEPGLPRVFRWVEKQSQPVLPEEYQKLFEWACRVWDVATGQKKEPDPPDAELYPYVCQALRLNYRIEECEVGALGLIADKAELWPCAHATASVQLYLQYVEELEREAESQKKTSSAPGVPS